MCNQESASSMPKVAFYSLKDALPEHKTRPFKPSDMAFCTVKTVEKDTKSTFPMQTDTCRGTFLCRKAGHAEGFNISNNILSCSFRFDILHQIKYFSLQYDTKTSYPTKHLSAKLHSKNAYIRWLKEWLMHTNIKTTAQRQALKTQTLTLSLIIVSKSVILQRNYHKVYKICYG